MTLRFGYIGSAERGRAIRWHWMPRHREVGVYIWRLHFDWTLPGRSHRRPGDRWSEWTAGSFRIVLFDRRGDQEGAA